MSDIILELKSERKTWEEASISQAEASISPYNRRTHAAFMECFLKVPEYTSQADNRGHIYT